MDFSLTNCLSSIIPFFKFQNLNLNIKNISKTFYINFKKKLKYLKYNLIINGVKETKIHIIYL